MGSQLCRVQTRAYTQYGQKGWIQRGYVVQFYPTQDVDMVRIRVLLLIIFIRPTAPNVIDPITGNKLCTIWIEGLDTERIPCTILPSPRLRQGKSIDQNLYTITVTIWIEGLDTERIPCTVLPSPRHGQGKNKSFITGHIHYTSCQLRQI